MNLRDNKESRDILDRITRLERAVFGRDSRREPTKKSRAGQAAGLPDHILALLDSGFFDSPRTASEVHQKLEPKYPCEPDRVAMALLRLQRRRQLRKASKEVGGRKAIAYAK